ncbi:MAG: hypothetical protein ACI85O_001032 [Saprospiraceae bacterium]
MRNTSFILEINPRKGSGQAAYQQLSFFQAKTEKNYTLSNLTELLFNRYLTQQ